MTIDRYTKNDRTSFLADFLPEGKAWEAKNINGTGMRRFLSSQSNEFNRLNDLMASMLDELDPRTTQIFINEWESALGIPDECIPIASTDSERRDNIVLKLSSLAIKTEADYVALAAQFGFTITFPPAQSVTGFPFTFPFKMGPTGNQGDFNWVISGNFPTAPSKAVTFKCLVKLLIPSYYGVSFVDA